jgi:hypothetical protein
MSIIIEDTGGRISIITNISSMDNTSMKGRSNKGFKELTITIKGEESMIIGWIKTITMIEIAREKGRFTIKIVI